MISVVKGLGKHSLGAGQTHEIHRHRNRLLFRPIHSLDLAGGKSQRRMDSKTRDFRLRMHECSDRRPLRIKPFQQTHRLKEVKGEWLATELLADFTCG